MRLRVSAFVAVLVAFAGLHSSTAAAAPAEIPECQDGMRCREVTVPLDWAGEQPGELKLDVRVTEGTGPLLLNLAGGPGQASSPYADYTRDWFESIAPQYRVAVFDQRGTGATAVRCNRLQSLPLTDLTVRPRTAVKACGTGLGVKRALYSTTASVRDIEAIRKALGVERMAVMGTSYGTYVAMRYARAYPNRVSRLILDSVVPQEDVDPMLRVHMRRAAKVLRWECGKGRCGFRTDPASDLARLVAMRPHRGKVPGTNVHLRVDGPAVLDWLTTILSFMPKDISTVGKGIHRASRGEYGTLLKVAHKARTKFGAEPAESISWGLHAATLCSDARLPFSIGKGNRKSRIAATSRYLSRVPERSFWPFDAATALGNGIVQTCADWPRTKVAAPPRPGKLKQPTLFLTGQYDLSTPVEYARRELRRAPKGKLVVVPKVGHSVAFQRRCSVSALAGFLRGELKGDPCRVDPR